MEALEAVHLAYEDVPEKIRAFFKEYPRVALAYSGGCDSAYLLACAVTCKADVKPYLVHSAFQYSFEPEDALLVANALGVRFERIDVDIFAYDEVVANPQERCYFCKRVIFSTILQYAHNAGIEVLIDGTNATDDPHNRPGFRALAELGVLSPLRLAGLTKDMIRERSRAAGLLTADKPNYSCLATRIPCGRRITAHELKKLSQPGWR